MVKICLDAGHYGKYNQSPCNKAYYESKAMWKLTEYLKDELLLYKDVHVVTTRTELEKDLALYSRGQRAKGYDLFISNHSNAVGNRVDKNVDYVVVYCSFKNKNNADDLGLRLAKEITGTMGTKQVPRTATRKSEKGDYEYYGVLRGADDVGCPLFYIVENSFHTNPKCTEWLLQDENLKKLAQAQTKAIAEYYKLSKKIIMPAKTITPGSSKEDINWLKTKLNALGGPYILDVNGTYDNKTRISMLWAWEAWGWNKDGMDDGWAAGAKTIKKLS